MNLSLIIAIKQLLTDNASDDPQKIKGKFAETRIPDRNLSEKSRIVESKSDINSTI